MINGLPLKLRSGYDIKAAQSEPFQGAEFYPAHVNGWKPVFYRDIAGRIKAYHELKQIEAQSLGRKIKLLEERVDKLAEKVEKSRKLAAANQLDDHQLKRHRKNRFKLYHSRNRLNRLKQRLGNIEKQIMDGTVSIGFGSKKEFKKQFHLKENHIWTHSGWRTKFQDKRDAGISFLGRAEELCGNQLCQLHPEENNTFTLKIIMDASMRTGNENYVTTRNIHFSYLGNELRSAIKNRQPITCRIVHKKKSWYLIASFSRDQNIFTDVENGMTGIDFNSGFLEVVEINCHGNMVQAWNIPLLSHGKGLKGKTELEQVISHIVQNSLSKGKPVSIENLDFRKKKAVTLPGKSRRGKAYNRMIHTLDYARYSGIIENSCTKYGVELKKVNPKNTSKTGKQKYAKERKLTVHRAAALVIARRGMGFMDQLLDKAA